MNDELPGAFPLIKSIPRLLLLILLVICCLNNVVFAEDCSPLPPGTGKDFEVTKPYCAAAGVYNYGFINIHSGGKLIFQDGNIDLWAKSILVENDGTLIAGTPEDPIGKKNIANKVTIHLYGDDQGPGIKCKTTTGPASSPDTICGVPKKDWISSPQEKIDLPAPEGTPKTAIPKDYFYKYQNLPTYTDQTDGDYYFGRKVLAVSYGGTIRMFGRKGATYDKNIAPDNSGTSWVRLDQTANPKEITIKLDRIVDWQKGDRIVVTTTDYLPGHSEMLNIDDTDVRDGKTLLEVDKKKNGKDVDIEYPHNGQKYSLAAVPERLKEKGFQRTDADTRAAVALLSRNIRIVSEQCTSYDPATGNCPGLPKVCNDKHDPNNSACSGLPEVPGNYFGGHTIVRQGAKQYQVQGVEFYQLGQGGRMSHSPVNFHLVRQAPPDTFVRDSSVNESMTRWYEIRGTQQVALERNVGWKSIGHGYLLADGSETNNVLMANIGVYARPAIGIYNDQGTATVPFRDNPRMVPGVLAEANELAYRSIEGSFEKFCRTEVADTLMHSGDYVHPSVFFIMNGYNRIEHNLAAGAGTCGACFWIAPALVSGPSAQQVWEGYANIQKKIVNRDGSIARDTPGTAPIKSFKGNFCSTAMYSLLTVGGTGVCGGVSTCSGETDPPDDSPNAEKYKFIPIKNKFTKNYREADYPEVRETSNLVPTRCKDGEKGCLDKDGLAQFTSCAKGKTEDCVVSVIDSYTSSFHWAQLNFAAIWLRNNWFLVTDTVLSDVLQGGLTMVSGGSPDQVVNGYWALTRRSAFIGNTQKWLGENAKHGPDENAFATNAGPFNIYSGLQCDDMAGPKEGSHLIPASLCMSRSEGIAMPTDNFGNYQRLYNIYDGPVYQETNAYLDIKKTPLDCTGPAGKCCTDFSNGRCSVQTQYMVGGELNRAMGIPRAKEYPYKGKCFLPNAAIGWKQPNGFYYPPAFHSRNLFFDNVDLRHYIVVPLFDPGKLTVNEKQVRDEYCTYGDPQGLFANGFTDVDRQTELNDDDGSLAGIAGSDQQRIPGGGTISVNRDKFFQVPRETIECLSEQSCFQVPYDYVSAIVYPSTVKKRRPETAAIYCKKENNNPWCDDCQDRDCYGVPLYRQLLKEGEEKSEEQGIRMMGTGIFQRSTLVANKGVYYLDTLPSEATQRKSSWKVNAFEGGKAYNVFMLYAKPSTRVTFQLYVGPGLDLDRDVSLVRAGSEAAKDADFDGKKNIILVTKLDQESPMEFTKGTWPAAWIRKYNDKDGILTVTMDMSDVAFAQDFKKSAKESCRPKTFCTWNDNPADTENGGECVYNEQEKVIDFKGDSSICAWSVKARECPSGGCLGFQVVMPKGFVADSSDRRPDPVSFKNVGAYYEGLKSDLKWNYDSDWKIDWNYAAGAVAGDAKLTEYSETFTISAIDAAKKVLTLSGGIGDDKYGYTVVKKLDAAGRAIAWAWLDKGQAIKKGDRQLTLDRTVDWQAGDPIQVSTASACVYTTANPPPPVPENLWKK